MELCNKLNETSYVFQMSKLQTKMYAKQSSGLILCARNNQFNFLHMYIYTYKLKIN